MQDAAVSVLLASFGSYVSISRPICRILGRDLVETPGGHAAAGTHPIELSRTLHHALSICRTDDPGLEPDQPEEQQ